MIELRRRSVVAIAILLVLGGLLCAWLVSGGSSPAANNGGQSAGVLLPGSARLELDLIVRQRSVALERYLAGLADPSSPLYGHYLSPAQVGQRFGIDARNAEALERELRRLGFRVLRLFPQRNLISVSASVATLERTFRVRLRNYRAAHVGVYHKPNRSPVLPARLERWVSGVSGLDTDLPAVPAALPDASGGALRAVDATSGYDIAPLAQAAYGSDDGHGQTIGVISIGPFSLTQWQRYATADHLPGPTPQTDVLSKPSVSSRIEGDLDLETIHAVAPGAQIIDYETSLSDLPSAIMTIVNAHRTTIISGSFGLCDGTKRDPFQIPSGYRRAVESAFATAALSGVTFFFATGDTGAYACQQNFATDKSVSVQFPSDVPYDVAVGGTVLSLNQNGAYVNETGWQDSGSNGGGGGGLNPYDAAPPWEIDVQGISTGARETPDVSAAAGDASPWWVYDGRGGSGWEPIGGTSGAAPFWAASMLLVDQYMQSHGAGPLCFAAPLLYGIASESWRFSPFHDVTLGGNRYYDATPGWDFATGWGSPDVYNLATAAIAYRQAHPLPSGTSACASSLTKAVGGG